MKKHITGLKKFIQLYRNAKSERLTSDLFNLFLTEEEKKDLAARYFIIQALVKKTKPQREIAKDLQVSIAKITRGSNELKRIHPVLLDYLEKNL